MIARRQAMPRFQSIFYRDCYYKTIKLLLFQVIIVLALIMTIVYYVFVQPPSKYFITTTSGQIMSIKGTIVSK